MSTTSAMIVVAIIAGVSSGGLLRELIGAWRAGTLRRRDLQEGDAALVTASSAFATTLHERLKTAEQRIERLEAVVEAERTARHDAEDSLDAERDRRIRAEMERDQLARHLADQTA